MSNSTELRSELREVEPGLSKQEIDDLEEIAKRIMAGEASLQEPTEEGFSRNRREFLEQVALRSE